MSIEKAEKIFGWLPTSELRWLRQQASIHQKIVEIGSFMGRSTRVLAENTRGTVTAVDTWAGSDEQQHRDILDGKPADWLFKEFKLNMAGLTNVAVMRMLSLDAAKALVGNTYDMVFIDASHDYDNVKADIEAWLPLTAPGGLFCGHDFHSGAPGVMRAVAERFPNARVFESIWYSVLPR